MLTIIVSLAVIIASVYILAIITEEFFIVSLDQLSNQLKLPSDVAGASLMAMGSSAPELFIALIAVYLGNEHANVGIGTIVGSAIFNILVITGASAVAAGTMTMKRGAIERDIIFYLASIGVLVFVFWDGEIVLWEAGLMLVLYLGYLLLLWQWSRTNPEDMGEKERHGHAVKNREEKADRAPLKVVTEFLIKLFGIIARDPEKNYLWSLVISIAAIAGISYGLVESAVALSNALGLPPLIVSLTLLAAGTSAPDLIASIDVAEDGRGTMAVANAVGSNIFDILVGLGVPWMITIFFLHPTVVVGTDGLLESIFLLSATTIILYALLNTGRKLTRREGFILLGTYALYVGYIIITQGMATSAA